MDTGRFPAASFEARRARPRTDLTNDEYAEYLGVGLSLSDLRELAMRDTSGYEECIYEISPLDPDIVIQRFPDEIFHKVFENLSGRDLYNVQLTCKHLSGLAHDPLLYKALCENEFRYWDDHNNLDAKINAAASETDWQSLYTRRKADESTILQRLGQLVHEPQLRARVLEGISASQYNYDYKDVFLECCKPGYTDPNDTEVVDLARQYWARQALDIIHRTKALEKWYHFKWSEPGMKPEIILGAFDMFIIHDRGMDIKEISAKYDDVKLEVIAKQRAEGRPDIGELTQRQKAHDIIRCLKELKYLGLQPHRPYRDIRNNYAGVALESTEHSSLPLISVSIVVAVAARFGLKVHFVAVLSHVFAGVDIHDHNKPGGPLSSKPHDRAYFDPFSDYKEYPLDSILNNLNEQGLEIGTDPELPHHLRITNTLEIVQRAKRNIHYVSAPGVMPSSFDVPRASIYGPQAIDRQLAQYSTAWASYHFSPTGRAWQILIEQYQKSFPGDRQLINKYLCDERCSRLTAAQQEDCRRILEETRKKNEEPSKVKPRDRLTAGTVKYFVGQCFQHRTQGFIGAIVGWDEYDDHDPNRNQGSFYFCLAEDNAPRYLAEQNINIITPADPPGELLGLAGKYFKRWDYTTRRFVSNIKHEYPDD